MVYKDFLRGARDIWSGLFRLFRKGEICEEAENGRRDRTGHAELSENCDGNADNECCDNCSDIEKSHFLHTLKAKKQGFYFFVQTLKS